MSYKIIDLFAGVGGLSLGFEMEGFNVVVANEYDPSAQRTATDKHVLSPTQGLDFNALPFIPGHTWG